MCIRTSGGWTVPIGGVYGLEEDKHSLMVLIRLMRQHCVDHGVDAHVFNKRVPDIPQDPDIPQGPFPRCADESTNKLLRTYQYPPEWHSFMVNLECDKRRTQDKSDELVGFIPHGRSQKGVLHADSGPAFVSLGRYISVHFLLQQFVTTTFNLH